MLIAFYSNVRGSAGTTSNLCCIASYLALQSQAKVLMWENHINWNAIGNNVVPMTRLSLLCESLESYSVNPTKELFGLLLTNVKVEVMLTSMAKEVYSKKLYYLPIRQQEEGVYEKEILKVLPTFLELCKKSKEYIFMDIQDTTKESTQAILSKADLIIYNLPQNVRAFDKILMKLSKKQSNSQSKVRYLIGNYQPDSKINISNIARKYHIAPEQIAAIPYNTSLQQALSTGKIIDFIVNNMNCNKRDYNYSFMKALQKATQMVVDGCEFDYNPQTCKEMNATMKTQKGRCEDCYI